MSSSIGKARIVLGFNNTGNTDVAEIAQEWSLGIIVPQPEEKEEEEVKTV